jgi:hypothetical protein
MAILVSLRVTPEVLRQMPGLSDDAIERAITRVLAALPDIAKRYVPERTGRLLGSLSAWATTRGIRFGFHAEEPVYGFDYSRVVEKGRAGGTILTPKRAKAMRFEYPYGSGNIVFAKRVKHGAMAGRYYAEGIKNDAKDLLIDILSDEFMMMGG